MSNLFQGLRRVLRAIHIFSSLLSTKGSYITVATLANDTIIHVENTADFSSSGGSGHIIDTTNDRDDFTYTGKTAHTLTGCSGVLAHNNGATIIPLVKCIVVDENVNEMRFFGDRGDGTIDELASIGLAQYGTDYITLQVGKYNPTAGFTRWGIQANTYSGTAVFARSQTSTGVYGISVSGTGVLAQSQGSQGLFATGSISQDGTTCAVGVNAQSEKNYAAIFWNKTNNVKSQIRLIPMGVAGPPTHSSDRGSFWLGSTGKTFVNRDNSTGWYALLHGPIWNETVSSNQQAFFSPTLDGNADGDYEIDIWLVNPTLVPVLYYIWVNEDYTAANYNYDAVEYVPGVGVAGYDGALPLISALPAGELARIQGTISISPDGFVNISITEARKVQKTVNRRMIFKNASVTNLTSIDIGCNTVNAIGAGSRIRLWQKR